LAGVFSRPRALLSAQPFSIVHGWIIDRDVSSNAATRRIDEVLVSVYRSPRSFTGEDSADISCHGGIAALKAVMAALRKAGFRDALPGEFSFRAFMNGKIDLTRAESVMEIVSAKTERGREGAVHRLAGALEKEISELKALLLELLSGVEIRLDYSEDELEAPEDNGDILPGRKLAEEAASRLKSLSDHWRREHLYSEGVLAVLAGRPNAGKSSLFNCLLREDRAIVSGIPGTTRDWIEAIISVEGVTLRLIDTAGLGTCGFDNSDEAEKIGVKKSFELFERADLVLYVIDGAEGITPDDREFLSRRERAADGKPMLLLWNKADLVKAPELREGKLEGTMLAVSARTGAGIQGLLNSIASLLEAGSSGNIDAVGPGTLRQKELIDAALASVKEALNLVDSGETLDIIAPLFSSALSALGEITGTVYNAELLELMFSRFCVGK
jgi:tRNA modification GTPase